MAELVLGPVIEKLSDVILEYLKDQVRRQKGMQEEVKKLRDIQPQIKAMMSAYRQVEIQDLNLNKWYWQLRDAIDEADDVLDEIEYRNLQKQASKNDKTGKVRSLMKSVNKRFVEISKRAIKMDSYLERLEVAMQKLNEISAKVSEFIHLVDITKQEQQQQRLQLIRTRETGAMLGNDFVGRSNEITRVKDWLRNSYETRSINTTDLYRNISVLSLVGHGGMGKTTLLQHVYDKNPTLFDLKMWVCVSTNFDAKTVIKNILESLENRRPDQESLHSLQTSLRSKVTSKKFLLVLDDIWEEGDGKWETVLSPLQYGSSGSKILISTRIPSVASTFANMIKNNQIIKLEGLEKDGCLQLFNKYAFAGRENPGGNFTDIAKNMVEKLSQCPLAVKFISNFLNTCVEESFWTNVLNSSIANIKSGENGLLAILKLSYTYLPDHLQNCFSFCCIFPQDHEFDRDDLVRMWIAVGFIQSPDIPGETLENTGRRYFNILVRNSFFDEFHADDYRVYYKMHDLLHDLAQSVSLQECSRVIVDDKNLSISDTTRHLSIHCSSLEVLKKMKKFKNLRSLIIYHSDFDDGFDENLISQILKASDSLRLLVICLPCNYFRPHKVSEMIDCLIHLRYLKVHYGFLKPSRSLSHLHHLQFVICQRWLPELPSSVMYLDIQDILEQECLPSLSAISSLNHLAFYNNNLLKSLPDLPSTLKKLDICRVHTLQCLPSSLSAISSLDHLTIKNNWWLESLSDLPSSLKKLVLCSLSGLKCLPSCLPSSLKELQLYELCLLNCLPSSLSAISSLETLALGKIPQLKSLPDLPSSLMHLHLIELENLECLPSFLPARLHELRIENVPRLQELPDFPASLEVLYIEDCDPLLMEHCESFRRRKAE